MIDLKILIVGLGSIGKRHLKNILSKTNSEIIILCIGNDNDVRDVIAGDEGILNTMRPGGIIVDHTTTSSILSHFLLSKIVCLFYLILLE